MTEVASRGSKPALSALAGRRDRVSGMAVFSRYSLAPVHSPVPVVLLHGLVVASGGLRPALQRIGNHHRCHAPDLPGYGLSSKPERVLEIDEQAQLLADWMELLGLRDAVVGGVSMGTQLATALAAQRPDLVRGLILASPTMDPQLRSRPKALAHWLLEAPSEQGMAGVTLRDYRRAGIRRAVETISLALGDRIERRLVGLDMPALVLHGERDHLVSREWAERIADGLPNGRLIEVPGAAHAMNFSFTDEFAGLVTAFATELAARAPEAARPVAA